VSWKRAAGAPAGGVEVPLPPPLPKMPEDVVEGPPDAGPTTRPPPPPTADAGPPPPPPPIEARMGDVRQEDGIDLITLDKGSKDGLDIGWQGKLLKGRSGQTPLTAADYDLIVDSVTATSAVAELVGMTLDQVGTKPAPPPARAPARPGTAAASAGAGPHQRAAPERPATSS